MDNEPEVNAEDCEECWIATAVNAIATLCDEEEGMTCTLIDEVLGDENTPPEEWIKRMRKICDESSPSPRGKCDLVLDDLRNYLERRNSHYLEAFKDGASNNAAEEERP